MKSMPTVCIDTNIWLYAFASEQANDSNKKARAQAAIKSAGQITLTPQIINELGFNLIRKHGWTNNDLQTMIEDLLKQCTLHIPSSFWHLHALQLREDYQIVELKLAGNKDEELYRYLLLGQCHQLHKAMPFLFEALDDETELMLPDNLTRTDSILRGLVDGIPEEDWQPVEIIGWLYQFYISEKKDQVIGNVVKSEDIPAATQLFTPNWIVKYLVQNSFGRLWSLANPDSTLKNQWAYYIEPAEQTPEVQAQLDNLIKNRISE